MQVQASKVTGRWETHHMNARRSGEPTLRVLSVSTAQLDAWARVLPVITAKWQPQVCLVRTDRAEGLEASEERLQTVSTPKVKRSGERPTCRCCRDRYQRYGNGTSKKV